MFKNLFQNGIKLKKEVESQFNLDDFTNVLGNLKGEFAKLMKDEDIKTQISEIKDEFMAWTKQRKFAPTIHALKAKLNTIKEGELNFQRKKLANFDEEQAELITARIIQKITNHFANHLKDDETMVDESIEWIEKIFQLETVSK